MSTTAYRTLADQLRGWPVERLSRLLHQRPDLATPAPHDSGQLASRAATRSSVLRALDQLNRFELCVLDALVVVGQTSADDLVDVVHGDAASVHTALDRLLDLALAWESPQGLRALTTVAESLTPGHARRQRPATGLRRPADRRRGPASGSPRCRRRPERCSSTSSTRVARRRPGAARQTVLPEDAKTPAEELLAHRLLVPRPGGARDAARRGRPGAARRPHDDVRRRRAARPGHLRARPGDGRPGGRGRGLRGRTPGGADARRSGALQPPAALRSGGLGVRDLRALATELHVDEPTAALLVEVASAAGLLSTAAGPDGDPRWIPTDAFDAWTARPTAERWLTLVAAWLESPRLPGLVGSRDPAGKTWNALAPELVRPAPGRDPHC